MSRPHKKLSARFWLLSLMLAASGCSSTVAIDSCSWLKPISVSKDDVLTDRTVEEILVFNEKYEAICGK